MMVVSLREWLIAFLIFALSKYALLSLLFYTTLLCFILQVIKLALFFLLLSFYFLVIIIFCCFHTLFIILHVLIQAHIESIIYTTIQLCVCCMCVFTRLQICRDSRQQRGAYVTLR